MQPRALNGSVAPSYIAGNGREYFPGAADSAAASPDIAGQDTSGWPGRRTISVRALIPQMLATMYAAPGIGLAAPQVGHGLRFAVVDLQPDEKPAPIHLINPEVVAVSDEWATREEGCLSLPGQYADVSRPAKVKVRYRDLEGRGPGDRGRGLARRLPAA